LKELQLQQTTDKGLRLLPQPEEHRLLHPRKEAAWLLGISIRSLDYLIANKQLATRKIGGRVLIPHSKLVRFSKADHFEQISMAA
jgi:hypothetical protein